MDKALRTIIIARDVTCIAIGATGLLQQMFVGPASAILVPAFVTLLLSPVGAALLAQRSKDGPSTTGPSSPPPTTPQPQPSSPQP